MVFFTAVKLFFVKSSKRAVEMTPRINSEIQFIRNQWLQHGVYARQGWSFKLPCRVAEYNVLHFPFNVTAQNISI